MAAHHLAGVSREFIGDMVESSRMLDRARELHDPAEHDDLHRDVRHRSRHDRARDVEPSAVGARLSGSRRPRARARRWTLARSQRQPMTLAFALVVAQGIHLYRGELRGGRQPGRRDRRALRASTSLQQEAEWGRAFQGSAMAARGAPDEGIDQLKDSLAVQQAIGSGLVRTTFLAAAGRGALRARAAIDEGLETVSEGFAHAERTFEGGYVAELHRVRGELFDFAGNRDAAEERSARRSNTRAGRRRDRSSCDPPARFPVCLRTSGRDAGSATPRSRRCTNGSPRATTPPIC